MKAPQLELPTGDTLRANGTARVIAHNPEYVARFNGCAAMFLDRYGELCSDMVVHEIGLPNGSPNAVGACMRAFAIAKGLAVDRYVKSTRPSCRSAVVAVWKRQA